MAPLQITLITSLCALIIRASTPTIITLLAYTAWAALYRTERAVLNRTIFIAGIIPICGAFPDLVAGLVFINILALDLSRFGLKSITWAAPAIILTGVWAITRALSEFDIAPFVYLFQGRDGPGDAGLSNILRWLRGGPPGYYVAIEDCIRITLIASLWSTLQGERGRAFAKGLVFGGALCAIFAVLEFFAPTLFATIREPASFWKGIGRMTSFATDPNALGVLVGALIPIAYSLFNKRSLPLILALLLGGLYSGSRSFFLLPIITACYSIYHSGRLRYLLYAFAGCIITVGFVVSITPLLSEPPAGLIRLSDSLNPARISTTLESRTIFSKLSIAAFQTAPIMGVGLGRFDEYVVPLSYSLNLGTGLWRDGAPSAYLEVLSELGILGVLVFAIVALSLKTIPNSNPLYRGVGIAFLIILAIMPHTNFPEGVAVAGLLLAQTVAPRTTAARLIVTATLIGSIIVPLSYPQRAIYGFYPWEQNRHGFLRWTAAEAAGALQCQGPSELKLVNASPLAQEVEVRDSIESTFKTLNPGESLSRTLPCQNGEARYLLNVSPGFTPAKFGFRGDNRLLGVRQVSERPIP